MAEVSDDWNPREQRKHDHFSNNLGNVFIRETNVSYALRQVWKLSWFVAGAFPAFLPSGMHPMWRDFIGVAFLQWISTKRSQPSDWLRNKHNFVCHDLILFALGCLVGRWNGLEHENDKGFFFCVILVGALMFWKHVNVFEEYDFSHSHALMFWLLLNVSNPTTICFLLVLLFIYRSVPTKSFPEFFQNVFQKAPVDFDFDKKPQFSSGQRWHVNRVREILQNHPEIRGLYGVEPLTILFVFAFFVLDVMLVLVVSMLPFLLGFVMTVVLVGFVRLSAAGGISHDVGHFLASKNVLVTRVLEVVLSLSRGPFITRARCMVHNQHRQHHIFVRSKYDDEVSMYAGKRFLMWFSSGGLQKVSAFVMLVEEDFRFSNPFQHMEDFLVFFLKACFYPSPWPLIEVLVSTLYWLTLSYFWGWRVFILDLIYERFSFLNPLHWRTIAMHYRFGTAEQATSSIYDSWFNISNFNLGYHVEHHDFIRIPWTRLPQVRKMAPEYYTNLQDYHFWQWTLMCLWKPLDPEKLLNLEYGRFQSKARKIDL